MNKKEPSMSPVDWYYARENKQTGPVSALELKRLAVAGELRPADLVWREGMTEWSPASNVRGLFDGEAKPADSGLKIAEPAAAAAQPSAAEAVAPAQAKAPRRHPLDGLLEWLRPRLGEHFIEATAKTARACGSYGLLAAMLMAAVFAAIMTVKTGHFGYLLEAAGGILVLAVLQYVAGRSCDAIDQVHAVTSGTLSSTVVPECFALLSTAAGVSALLIAVAHVVATPAFVMWLPFGIAAFLVGVYLAALALNPAALGVSVVPVSRASEETLGVLTFLLKALLRSVSVVFGSGVICGALLLAFACGQVFKGEKGLELATDTAAVAQRSLWWFGALPLAAYVVFLLGCLLLDLWRSVLSLTGRRE
jgi:hypothetical protein